MARDDPELEALLETAEDAAQEGDWERAFELLEGPWRDTPRVRLMRASLWVDLEDVDAAGAELAAVSLDADDPDLLWVRGRLALRRWRPEEARRELTRLSRLAPSADVHELLALCADLLGDEAEADRQLREAARLDPEGHSEPARLSTAGFEAEVHAAAQALPLEFREALERAAVVVEPVPFPDSRSEEFRAEFSPEILGLFEGASDLDLEGEGGLELPPRIVLFQRNLERSAAEGADLREQIRVTLYHELGHLLGFDEEGVADLGLA